MPNVWFLAALWVGLGRTPSSCRVTCCRPRSRSSRSRRRSCGPWARDP